jgi:hypothetical protein
MCILEMYAYILALCESYDVNAGWVLKLIKLS